MHVQSCNKDTNATHVDDFIVNFAQVCAYWVQ